MKRRELFLTLATLVIVQPTAPLRAAPAAFAMDTESSVVTFTYDLAGQEVAGSLPVQSARLSLDLENVPNSQVTVTLNVAGANAGNVFFTQAMTSQAVLNTGAHPTARFVSRRITGDVTGARIEGDLTLRGVTAPVVLDALLYRQAGTDPTDRDRLQILLTGSLDRHDFAASGYRGLVGPDIDLRIVIRIQRAP